MSERFCGLRRRGETTNRERGKRPVTRKKTTERYDADTLSSVLLIRGRATTPSYDRRRCAGRGRTMGSMSSEGCRSDRMACLAEGLHRPLESVVGSTRIGGSAEHARRKRGVTLPPRDA